MRTPIAIALSMLAAAALAFSAPVTAKDGKTKSVKTAKKIKKKPKEESASGGATAPMVATDLGFEAERDEARIRRRNARLLEESE